MGGSIGYDLYEVVVGHRSGYEVPVPDMSVARRVLKELDLIRLII